MNDKEKQIVNEAIAIIAGECKKINTVRNVFSFAKKQNHVVCFLIMMKHFQAI